MTSAELELTTALLGTGLVLPHKSYVKGGRAEILCRPVPGQDPRLLELLKVLLVKAEEAQIHLHVCKRFVAKEGALAYGWNFAIDAANNKKLKEAIDILKPILEEAKPSLQDMAAALTPAPATAPQPPSAMDRAAAARQAGVVVDREAGVLGKLAPERSQTVYQPGVRLPGAAISLIDVTRDDNGTTSIFEMPLPHVSADLNVPKKYNPETGRREPHPDGAGASLYGKRSFGRRR